MRIGFFGGTFDPVHLGHIHGVVEAKIALDLDKIIMIPAKQSPLKDESPTGDAHRIEMLKRAAAPYGFMEILEWEITREGVSYTFDTVQYLKEEYPSDERFFLIGSDQYEGFHKWHRHEALLKMMNFVVMSRRPDELAIDERFTALSQPVMEISSTVIRERIKKGEVAMHQLEPSVYQYIKEHRLYET
ncbi:nicotinate (nicotinamide) nucleotide adenylyltransferase [Salinicoccus siamensis]|uniref:Probable nicotinate-nucleotide adenylyltransferase n=1 Tax=Salinicoccus siamensis TaxID=381830 RepID=A0ABV5Z3M7_9STAP